jgi:hypothetical protein
MSGSGSDKGIPEKDIAIISHILFGRFSGTGSISESELDAFFFSFRNSDASLLQEKQDKLSIVELKNGKVVFKQKPISFEKQSDTLQGESYVMTYWSRIQVICRDCQIPRNAGGPY